MRHVLYDLNLCSLAELCQILAAAVGLVSFHLQIVPTQSVPAPT